MYFNQEKDVRKHQNEISLFRVLLHLLSLYSVCNIFMFICVIPAHYTLLVDEMFNIHHSFVVALIQGHSVLLLF